MDPHPHRPRRPSAKQVGAFTYVWLMVGFAAGTLVLLAPARWVTDLARGRGWGQGTEDLLMMVVIAIYVVASIAVAATLTRLLFQYRARVFKYGLVAGLTAIAGLALWGWTNPAVYASMAGARAEPAALATESGAVFLFGPYPDYEKLQQLKAEGVTAVISLQHPAVVPFEPQGIEEEKRATAELGLRMIHAPMLPWVSDNEAALATIRRIATEETGRFYVHCGLGRDRVNVVMHVLQKMGARTGPSEIEAALSWEGREAAGLERMERGKPLRIGAGAWLVPRPNEHELFGNMLAGQAGLVVLLLDPQDAEQGPALTEMLRLFDLHGVDYLQRPLRAGDEAAALRIAEEVHAAPRPLTVVAPDLRPEGSQVADLFLREWTRLTAVPE